MNQAGWTHDDRYRFVGPSGKTTAWRRIPKNGLSGPVYARARRLLGEHFDLEIQKRSVAPVSSQNRVETKP